MLGLAISFQRLQRLGRRATIRARVRAFKTYELAAVKWSEARVERRWVGPVSDKFITTLAVGLKDALAC